MASGSKKKAGKRPASALMKKRPPKSKELAARKAVIATAQAMSESKLSPGRSGNVSCRWHEGMLITPSGLAYDTLKPSDIVYVDDKGDAQDNAPKPSSEWRFHLAVYKVRDDAGAVVHTHSMHATVLAAAHKPIPAFHYMVAVAGGLEIPLVPYAPFGTEELAEFVGDGIRERNACLMANHGQIALGGSLDAALELAAEVEVLAEQYYKVLTLDSVQLLNDAQMQDVLERFQSYGANVAKAEKA